MKITLIATALLATAAPAAARDVFYPERYCAEIVSSEYSTGGGDSSFEMFEILCRDAQGNYRAFITSWASVAGFFGLGRVAHETQINLIPHSGEELITQ